MNIEQTTTTADPETFGGASRRRSRWVSSLAALRHVSDSLEHSSNNFRTGDKVTNVLMVFAVLVGTALAIFPSAPLMVQIVFDTLVGAALVFYGANRLGVLTMLSARQAVLIWELILAAIIFGSFITLNIQGLMHQIQIIIMH
ncbi:MAG: hypothetical protein KGS72_27685 [Cyanobacteria bacterium REEB67]|nr:hypothetical protein [Cyanobacteria bacterium REEB67]